MGWMTNVKRLLLIVTSSVFSTVAYIGTVTGVPKRFPLA